MINVEDIVYIDVQDHSLTYHCGKQELTVIGSMNKVESDLERYNFVRIHNAFTVNMKQISEVQARKLILKNGKELPLSRGKKECFRKKYSEFWRTRFS